MKKRWLIIGMAALGLAAAVFLFPEETMEQRMARDMKNLETEVVRIELAGRHYDIPMRYLYGQAIEKYRRWPTAKKERVAVDALTLSVLLPDMRPYYPQDDARWKVKGHGDRVEVTIANSAGKTDWFQDILGRYLSSESVGGRENGPSVHGLIRFHGSRDRYFSTIDPELTMSCDTRTQSNDPKDFFSPSCSAKTNYKPGVVLDYYYGASHFPNWREIDGKLKSMFDGFERIAQSKDGLSDIAN